MLAQANQKCFRSIFRGLLEEERIDVVIFWSDPQKEVFLSYFSKEFLGDAIRYRVCSSS
jgi:hypothetical protein